MRADPDGLLVVFFGFTHCPDVCPTTLSDIGRAQERLDRSERRRVQVAFVTIDPARDDARVMNAFLRHFTSGGHALRTDDPAQLERAKDAFRVTARRIAYPGGGPDEYGFEHTSTAYVVDDSGTVVVEWPFGTRPGDMAADLRLLLSRARNR
jgi:protein SCO1/2